MKKPWTAGPLSGTRVQALVNRMTNWQRSQWARDGYKRDRETLEHFAALEKQPRDP